MQPIAVYTICNTAGVQIVECNEDYVCYLDPLGKWHRAKVYTNTSRAYFRYCDGWIIHLDECMVV